MDEPTVRKPRSDKGLVRGPRVPVRQEPAPAPINVRITLKNGVTSEFGAANHLVENGFHVFIYPCEWDRYRETRREFAVSEVVEVEITAPRPVLDFRSGTSYTAQSQSALQAPPVLDMVATGKPKIHSVRRHLTQMGMGNDVVSRLETSDGPIKMTEGDLSGVLGVGASVNGIGDSSS